MSGMFTTPKAPDYSPLANSQTALGKEQLELGREQLAYTKERDAEAMALAREVSDQAMATSKAEAERSQYYFDQYKTYGAPIDKRISEEAQAFNVEAEGARMAGQAQADIEKGFTQARGIQRRQNMAYGASPEKFAALNDRLMRDEALAIAGAKTGSRLQAREMGRGLLYNASQLFKGMPANASTASGVSTNAGSSAINAVNQTNAMGIQGRSSAQGWYQGASNSINSAGNLMNMGFSNQATAADISNKATAAILNAGGTAAAAFMADGGKAKRGLVRGPGSEISDSIPANLSDGEYVIPADVVKAKGVKFFDKLLDKHHTPAAVQAARKGLRRKK